MNTVIIGKPVEVQMNLKSVTLTDQPVQETIITAGYNWVNENIKKSETLIHNPGSRHMGIWHPNRDISSEGADETMKSMTTVIDGETYQGRSATVEELACYEAMFYEELGDMTLVALGEKVSDDSYEYVACRYVFDSKRKLYLDYWAHDWHVHCRFLVVFEKVSAPE